mgnify:CR=1 FL=1
METVIDLCSSQVLMRDVSSIFVRGRWIDICSIEYLGALQLGEVKHYPNSTVEKDWFMPHVELNGWVKVETSENQIVYFSVSSITGIRADGPSGG